MVWIQKIMESYTNQIIKLNTKLSAQLYFIEQLKKNPLWNVQQFIVKVNYFKVPLKSKALKLKETKSSQA